MTTENAARRIAAVGLLTGVLALLLAMPTGASAATTERVSVDSAGIEGNGYSRWPALSADGRFVAFCSSATNLVPGDTNWWTDVFARDRQTGITERVSVASDGTQADFRSCEGAMIGRGVVSISADGRFVAFFSMAGNLAPPGAGGRTQVFVRDRQTGTTRAGELGQRREPGERL